jgi:hypothetical protein
MRYCNLYDLPDDVLEEIAFNLLQPKDILNGFGLVSSRLRSVCMEQSLWKKLCKRDLAMDAVAGDLDRSDISNWLEVYRDYSRT